MVATQKPRKQRKLKDRPIYFNVRKMIDPETGEEVGCLVPDGDINRLLMRERKIRTNDHLRATLQNPRNSKFHRLVHQLGTLVRQNIEGFENFDSHTVIKRLQQRAGVCCELQDIELPGFGTLSVKTPQSIAFDCMDESDFRQLWAGICGYLVSEYWPDLSEDQITSMASVMPQSEEP